MIIREQPCSELDSNQVHPTPSERLELVVSKASVSLSWREKCILGSTPLSELNVSLLSNSTDKGSFTDVNMSDKKREDRESTLNTGLPQDFSSSSAQLAEWMGMVKGEDDRVKTPESTVDLVSEFSSADLLGIWFNCCDHKTQKVNSISALDTQLYLI